MPSRMSQSGFKGARQFLLRAGPGALGQAGHMGDGWPSGRSGSSERCRPISAPNPVPGVELPVGSGYVSSGWLVFVPGAQLLQERLTLGLQLLLQPFRAVTVGAGPGLLAVQVPAAVAVVGVLHSLQVEILLPVGAFFLQGSRTEADFDPADPSVSRPARLFMFRRYSPPATDPRPRDLSSMASSRERFRFDLS